MQPNFWKRIVSVLKRYKLLGGGACKALIIKAVCMSVVMSEK